MKKIHADIDPVHLSEDKSRVEDRRPNFSFWTPILTSSRAVVEGAIRARGGAATSCGRAVARGW